MNTFNRFFVRFVLKISFCTGFILLTLPVDVRAQNVKEERPVEERVPQSIGKEKYVAQVIARFIPRSWFPLKQEVSPYELGIFEEGLLFGPNSIAVSGFGDIYILDTQARLIRIYDKEGNFLQAIRINQGKKQQTGSDLCIDAEGCIYILQLHPPLHSYIKKYRKLDEEYCEIRKYTPQGRLVLRACFCFSWEWLKEERLILQKIYIDKKGHLYLGKCRVKSTNDLIEVEEIITGIPDPDTSNIFYFWDAEVSGYRGRTRIVYKGTMKKLYGEKTIKEFRISSKKELSSVKFLKEDSKGNVYLLLNKWEQYGVRGFFREIQKFDKKGTLIALITNLPRESGYDTERDIVVDKEGNIYWLTYSRSDAKLVKWHKTFK